jgi:hypothetical protein
VSYYNRPIVLHVEVLASGVWETDPDSNRNSVEAAVEFAKREYSLFEWRVVDAGGNVHETGKPVDWPASAFHRLTAQSVHITVSERERLFEEALRD